MSLAWMIAAVLLPSCGAYQLIATASRHLPRTTATCVLRFALAPALAWGRRR